MTTRDDCIAFLQWASEEIANGRAKGDGSRQGDEDAARIERGCEALMAVVGV